MKIVKFLQKYVGHKNWDNIFKKNFDHIISKINSVSVHVGGWESPSFFGKDHFPFSTKSSLRLIHFVQRCSNLLIPSQKRQSFPQSQIRLNVMGFPPTIWSIINSITTNAANWSGLMFCWKRVLLGASSVFLATLFSDDPISTDNVCTCKSFTLFQLVDRLFLKLGSLLLQKEFRLW